MTDLLSGLFASKVRAAVLVFLLPRAHRGYSLTELARATGLSTSSLQHECYKLVDLGVLRDRREGNARRYRPNPENPTLAPLTALVTAAVGLGPMLRAAIEDLDIDGQVAIAGILAPTADPPALLVIGNVPFARFADLESRLAPLLATLGLPMPALTYYRRDDWDARLLSGNALVAAWRSGPGYSLYGPPIVPSWAA